MVSAMLFFDFDKNADISDWRVVNDGVMGGLSKGKFSINDQGHGNFEGFVSLENNGGFSSVRYRFPLKIIKKYTKVVLRIKGDGKRYQFRVKTSTRDRYSYISYFTTTGDWQTIEIPLSKMYPAFRGRKLDLPNYPGETLNEIAFLIGNKKAESFALEIDYIQIK